MSTPYTYLIGWSFYERYYYGVRYARDCHPDELWKTYFTSSRYVKEFYRTHGEPDIVQVREVFDFAEEARQWEHKVLRRLSAHTHPLFLNRTNNKAIYLDSQARKELSERVKADWKKNPNRNDWKKGTKQSEETKRKISVANKGKKHSDEAKQKISKTSAERWKDPKLRKKMLANRPVRDSAYMKRLSQKNIEKNCQPFMTPWGKFNTIPEAIRHPDSSINDGATLTKYLKNPDTIIQGLRSPISGKTPREAGYYRVEKSVTVTRDWDPSLYDRLEKLSTSSQPA